MVNISIMVPDYALTGRHQHDAGDLKHVYVGLCPCVTKHENSLPGLAPLNHFSNDYNQNYHF